ncbi:hypothetical protein BH10CYA1_BH10CYA1_28350 [soil metagenome]
MISRILQTLILVIVMASSAQAADSNWFQTIMRAHEFADGMIGEGPHPSACYVAYREALVDPGKIKEQDVAALLEQATPAGKLYAACISYYSHIAQKRASECDVDLKKLVGDKSRVYYRSGCRGTESSVAEVATALLTEKRFLNFKLVDLAEIKNTYGIPDPMIRLARAAKLENDLIGEGSKSTTYAFFREALHLSIKANGREISWLKTNGTPAGRLYAGFLAMHFDEVYGLNLFRQMRSDDAKVQYVSGCESETFTVGSVAKEVVEKKHFADFPVTKSLKN